MENEMKYISLSNQKSKRDSPKVRYMAMKMSNITLTCVLLLFIFYPKNYDFSLKHI